MRQQSDIDLGIVIERKRPTHLLKFWLSGRHLVECVDLGRAVFAVDTVVGCSFGREACCSERAATLGGLTELTGKLKLRSKLRCGRNSARPIR